MKRIIIFSTVILLLFSSCSRQKEIDFKVFTQRLISSGEIIFDSDSVFKLENEFVCFLSDNFGNKYVLSVRSDEKGRVCKITLSCDNADIKNFIKIINNINSCYVCEDTSMMQKQLIKDSKLIEGVNYFDSDWYAYSTSYYNKFAQYSVRNKRLCNYDKNDLTLKSNDKSYLK